MPGFLDNLLGLMVPNRDKYTTTPPIADNSYQGTLSKLRSLNSNYPSGFSYLASIANARGSNEFGPTHPVPEEISNTLTSPRELGLADRYGTGKLYAEEGRSPLAFIPYVGYEGMKAAAQNPLLSPTARPLLSLASKAYEKMSGTSLKGNEWDLNDKTSPASLDNLKALWQGYSDENEKNPKEGFLSSLVNFE